ncbi:DNA gyrase inhibitor YacG [Roseimaritima multifibrata]|uniref:DNA gyrase inhibitor YacG n=2 Tax=Roseimaritima multifibrata TaxID=1930274 RepID=A0A517MFW4_9BACT|nr:DNA gyrase inhibitor YacG [Roseimaritima multifibrata]QDS93778.1 DNA gyrase inhibitor YacG [Roseimaritima multifibrata]
MEWSKLPATRMVCPTCQRKFLLDETKTPPFCSERCQMIDLGRWLKEENGLPFEGDPGDTPVEYRE